MRIRSNIFIYTIGNIYNMYVSACVCAYLNIRQDDSYEGEQDDDNNVLAVIQPVALGQAVVFPGQVPHNKVRVPNSYCQGRIWHGGGRVCRLRGRESVLRGRNL